MFTEPDRLDITRSTTGHLGFGHGPHFCLGASIARAQAEIALGALLKRYPELAFAAEPKRNCDGGTWRLAALPVRLTG